jgi:superoxide reductase
MTQRITEKIQVADWKSEKHVPVITCPDEVKANEWIKASVEVGKEIEHPNTTEHHIRWIRVFFVPDGGKFAHDLGLFDFNSHGEGSEGSNKGPVHTHPEISFSFKTSKSGTLNAVSYCNIHGLWESSKKIIVA